jgi:hypothetical protein
MCFEEGVERAGFDIDAPQRCEEADNVEVGATCSIWRTSTE